MARNVELLLLRTIENLGIVGDVVKVRPGHARNYLLPMGYAEAPSPEKIEALKEARAKAQAEIAAQRRDREALLERMQNIHVKLVRSANPTGVLYGSVSQRDIADALIDAGYSVDLRAVRLAAGLRRIGEYHVPIQFDRDLRTEITVTIESDQPIEEREEMEIDDEGNLVERPKKPRKARREAEAEAATADAAAE